MALRAPGGRGAHVAGQHGVPVPSAIDHRILTRYRFELTKKVIPSPTDVARPRARGRTPTPPAAKAPRRVALGRPRSRRASGAPRPTRSPFALPRGRGHRS